MPELPDITVYVEALRARIEGRRIEKIRLASPFFLRTFDPPLHTAEGCVVGRVVRLGKRIVLELREPVRQGGSPEKETAQGPDAPAVAAGPARTAGHRRTGVSDQQEGGGQSAPEGGDAGGGLFLVLHLMIAGRLRWKAAGAKVPGKIGLAAIHFDTGTLVVTEAATKKRASLHLVRGDQALAALDRGGLEPLDASLEAFRRRLLSENHTLKRALTDPRLFSGIGNAYSDEILHAARLSPLMLTSRLDEEELARLHAAVQRTLLDWTGRLRQETAERFPEKVTAFREGMAVHGRYGQACPECGTSVQRIVYAENECNYCPRCQTGGRLLADRALSRLLHDDWPGTIEELELGRP